MSAAGPSALEELEQALLDVVTALDAAEVITANTHMQRVNAVVAALDPAAPNADPALLSRIAALHQRAQRASAATRARLEKERNALGKPSQAAQVYRQYAAR